MEYTQNAYDAIYAAAKTAKAKFDLLWDQALADFIKSELAQNVFTCQGDVFSYALERLQYRKDGLIDSAVYNLAQFCADVNNPSVAVNIVFIALNYSLTGQNKIHVALNAMHMSDLHDESLEWLNKTIPVIKPAVEWYRNQLKAKSPDMAKGKLPKFCQDASRFLANYAKAREAGRVTIEYTTDKMVYGTVKPKALVDWERANSKPNPSKWEWEHVDSFMSELVARRYTVIANADAEALSEANAVLKYVTDNPWGAVMDTFAAKGIIEPLPRPVPSHSTQSAISLAIKFNQLADAGMLSDGQIVALNAIDDIMAAVDYIANLGLQSVPQAPTPAPSKKARTPRTKKVAQAQAKPVEAETTETTTT